MVCMLGAQATEFSTVRIFGKVTDISGTPLVGANIIISETQYGASSSLKGEYIITIPLQLLVQGPKTISTSYIGYKMQRDSIVYNNKNEIIKNFILSPDVLGLETVVVTGLGGDKERKKLGV